MSLNARDPQFGVKLTAYALGELEGREKQEVEEAVMSNPSLQREVAAIREMVGTLTRELEREPSPGLTREQRARIAEGNSQSKFAAWLQSFWAGLTPMRLVPVLAIGAVAFGYFGPFSSVLRRDDVNESAFKTVARPQAATPEGASQPVVPALRKEAPKDQYAGAGGKLAEMAPALTSEQDKQRASAEPSAEPKAQFAQKPSVQATSAPGANKVRHDAATNAPPPAAIEAQDIGAVGGAALQSAPMAKAPMPMSPAKKGYGAAAGGPATGAPAQMLSSVFGARTRGAAEKKLEKAKRASVADMRDEESETRSIKQDGIGNEAYDRVVDNEFKRVSQEPLSTFSIDVDTASYSNLRRFITGGSMPPKDSVRIEELVNYFPYSYETPKKGSSDPFAVNVEINQAPWNTEHRLVRIGLKGRELENGKRPPSNLVFLIDVSGSMEEANKLPWVKESLKMLANQLGENDKVSIVVYAGNSGLLLPPTRGNHKKDIIDALEHMEAGGSTNGGQGIELAYKVARENFIQGGSNRVILCSDGDWNVGVTSQGDLTRLIEQKAKEGVFLSVLGFGMGNLKDATMVKLADKGHGHYAYIDTLSESKKVLVEEIGSTLVTIAKDVKIQVEFNPSEVGAFRLIGYEKRILAHEDFNDDTKDAGIIGAGHTVTALYEIIPPGKPIDGASVDPLKYQKPKAPSDASKSGELMTLKLRYKAPEDGSSKLMTYPIKDEGKKLDQASKDFKFQSAVAGFGMLLRDSSFKGSVTYDSVIDLAQSGKGDDKQGYRSELIELMRKAKGFSIRER